MSKKKTTEEFIADAREVHGDKYDYSKVEYNGSQIPVVIICPKHGEFKQRPNDHLSRKGCKQCAIETISRKNRKTQEQFVMNARRVHGDKYDYSEAEYIEAKIPVVIICPHHGAFEQRPNDHLSGQGCPICGRRKSSGKRTLSTEEFIRRARKVHGDKYDYSKTIYKGCRESVTIICPKHGEFEQMAYVHLQGYGCQKCGVECQTHQRAKTTQQFIEEARKIYGDQYDYSLVKYVHSDTPVKIICPKHGVFEIRPSKHINAKQGCHKCALEGRGMEQRKTLDMFIEEARKVHGDTYDYSKVKYVNNSTKVTIICPIHGEFEQTPISHLRGCGCSKCNRSKLEIEVENALMDNHIENVPQKSFEWLKYKSPMYLDFYLPQYHIAIECQGIQHYVKRCFSVNKENAVVEFKQTQLRDKLKKQQCEEHGIKVLYFSHEECATNAISSIEQLLEEIKI